MAEAERGEDVAKDAFEEALKEPLPAPARTVVERQAAQVRQAHDRVRDIRDRDRVAHWHSQPGHAAPLGGAAGQRFRVPGTESASGWTRSSDWCRAR